MNTSSKPVAGAPMPAFTLSRAGGGEVAIGSAAGWQAVFVYRGKHCPLCRKYLGELNGQLDGFRTLGLAIVAISADTRDKAETEVSQEGWNFSVGYDLTLEQMHRLGVYVSKPRSPQETDRPFAEPGLFVVNPDGHMQIIDIANAPAARPALPTLLLGLQFIMKNDLPVRGTLA